MIISVIQLAHHNIWWLNHNALLAWRHTNAKFNGCTAIRGCPQTSHGPVICYVSTVDLALNILVYVLNLPLLVFSIVDMQVCDMNAFYMFINRSIHIQILALIHCKSTVDNTALQFMNCDGERDKSAK